MSSKNLTELPYVNTPVGKEQMWEFFDEYKQWAQSNMRNVDSYVTPFSLYTASRLLAAENEIKKLKTTLKTT